MAVTEQGTIWLTEGLLTESDPTAFQELRPSERGRRQMYDRRLDEGWVTHEEAHLFNVRHFSTIYQGKSQPWQKK